MRILRRDGSVLRARGLSGVAELITDGLVGPDDALLGGVRLRELDDLGWAFALGDEEPYASYQIVTD